jgi:sec-independent protein translocase protein TatA
MRKASVKVFVVGLSGSLYILSKPRKGRKQISYIFQVICMALDDPVVWVLIVAVIVFLFGSNKIPQIAKAIGQARRELDGAMKGITEQTNFAMNAATTSPQQPPKALVPPGAVANADPAQKITSPSTTPASTSDPLVMAAKNEGIDTKGKTRDQIATELAVKLNSSRKS